MSPIRNVSCSSVRSRTRAPGVIVWWNFISKVLAPPSLVSFGGAELSLFRSPHPLQTSHQTSVGIINIGVVGRSCFVGICCVVCALFVRVAFRLGYEMCGYNFELGSR